jgi:enoyl-CoA hydratase/carnithine racemase
MIYSGEFMSFSDAKIIGLIDVAGPPDELEDFTIARLSQIASYQNQAFAAVKANKVEAIKRRYQESGKTKNETFLDCWFSDSVQHKLREASVKF